MKMIIVVIEKNLKTIDRLVVIGMFYILSVELGSYFLCLCVAKKDAVRRNGQSGVGIALDKDQDPRVVVLHVVVMNDELRVTKSHQMVMCQLQQLSHPPMAVVTNQKRSLCWSICFARQLYNLLCIGSHLRMSRFLLHAFFLM